MNRYYTQFQLSLEKRNVFLFGRAAIGAVGAPTISATLSKGIASIARTGVGAYRITLQDKYVALLGLNHFLVLAAGAPAAVGGMVVRAASVTASTPIIDIEFVDGAGAAVELDSGTTLCLELVLKATSV